MPMFPNQGGYDHENDMQTLFSLIVLRFVLDKKIEAAVDELKLVFVPTALEDIIDAELVFELACTVPSVPTVDTLTLTD